MGREHKPMGWRADSETRAGRTLVGGAILVAFILALVAMVMPATSHAIAPRSPSIAPDGSRYYRDAATGTNGTAITFPGGTATSSVSIYNEDGSNALLVKFVRSGVAVASDELTAPADATWSEVQSIPAGATIVFDVRGSPGLIWDRAAGTGAFTIRLID